MISILPRTARAWAIVLIAVVFSFVLVSEAVGVVRTRDSQSKLDDLDSRLTSAAALDRALASFLGGATNLSLIDSPGDEPALVQFQAAAAEARSNLELVRQIAIDDGRDDFAVQLAGTLTLFDDWVAGSNEAALAYLDGGSAGAGTESELEAMGRDLSTRIQGAAAAERVALAEDRVSLTNALNTTLIMRLLFGGLAVLGLGLATGLLILRIIRPLRSLSGSVRAIAAGDLKRRAEEAGPDEVRSLARDVNQMAETMISRNRDLEGAGQELRALNETLEERVKERTAILTELNEELKAEVNDRMLAQEALIASEERFSKIFNASPIAVALSSADDAKFIDVNQACLDLMGMPRNEVLGRTALDLNLWADPESRERVGRILAQGKDAREIELKFRVDGGRILDAVCSFVMIEVRGRRAVLSILRDVTESKRAQEALERETAAALLLQKIAVAANHDASIDSILRFAIEEICAYTGWRVGHAYVKEVSSGLLVPSDIWCIADAGRYAAFKAETERCTFGPGQGLLGRVLSNARPEWINDVAEDETFHRRAPAAETGLRAAFAFPVMSGQDVVAVLEFFSGEPAPADSRLLNVMSVIGVQIGRVIERTRSQQALQSTNETLSALIDASPVAIMTMDGDLKITMWNKAAERTFGWRRSEVIGRTYDLIPDDRKAEFEALRLRVYSGEAFAGVETERLKKNGDRIDVSISTAPLRNSSGEVDGIVAILVDITERKRSENALRESEQRYRTLFSRNLAGVYRTTVDGQVLECNDALAGMLGYDSPEETIHRPVTEYYPDSASRDAFIQRILQDGRVTAHETQLRHRDGSSVWAIESASLTRTEEHPNGVIEGTMIDITERKRAEETVRRLAFHDTLTELPNRTLFVDRLKQALARRKRSGDMVAVLFLDIDHFKDVNDSVGHAEGDSVLRQVARRINKLLRDGDTLARFGGDEFIVLLPETESVQDAKRAAHRVLKAMRKPWNVNGRLFHLAASIGVTVAPLDGEDAETLLRNADTAMYRAKERGRNKIELYTSDMNARILARLTMENALRRAIKERQFVLHYQPQVDVKTGDIVGVEALVRWQHPDRGLVPPGEFIPVAEASGLIGPIGDWVLRQACEDARRWELEGLPAFRVAVNISARQFESRDLVEKIKSVLAQTGLGRNRLQIEITEGIAMTDIDFTIRTLEQLRAMGVQVAIDDFGTGHSSLSYIKRLPIDVVKIDRSFIRDLSIDPVDAALVTAIVAISHSMGLKVIAEGVETEEQLDFLRDPGNYPGLIQDRPCDEFQGFLFSKPIPEEELRVLLLHRRQPARPAAGG